ncbi:sulfurtransferase [Haloarcula laminariae]|uniref:sulfurtransferase n=1 Tax=Haloarcula laminariae TaxID=2961577 RepID=UPI003D68762F
MAPYKNVSLYKNNDAVRSAEWVREHLDRFESGDPSYRLVEVDMDPEQYEDWHIPGAVQIDWESDIIDGLGGNVVPVDEAESLFGDLGITPETTVVVYGDQANWFAGHAYWVLKYYGHENVALLDGGRRYWDLEGYETSQEAVSYPAQEYSIDGTNDEVRAYKDEVMAASEDDGPIVDVRNPQEYRGDKPPAEIPNTTDREGHIPSASNIPWGQAVNADGTFKHVDELREIYGDFIDRDERAIAYCRIGERSSVTWFVLSELLGLDAANYDGSWTEWAADPDAPVASVDKPTPQGGDN